MMMRKITTMNTMMISADNFEHSILSVVLLVFRTCLHKKCVRIFEHNFVADKAKIRRRAVARQEFLTQSAAKFAEKTCAYACEDRFLVLFSVFKHLGGCYLSELSYKNCGDRKINRHYPC